EPHRVHGRRASPGGHAHHRSGGVAPSGPRGDPARLDSPADAGRRGCRLLARPGGRGARRRIGMRRVIVTTKPSWTRATGRIRAAWAAATGTGAAASVVLGVLVAICAFVVVALPRASLGYRTQVLQRLFRDASSAQTTVLADSDITGL